MNLYPQHDQTDFEYAQKVGWFVLERLHQNYSTQWLGGPLMPRKNQANPGAINNELKRRRIEVSEAGARKLNDLNSLEDLFRFYHLRSVREDSQRALVNWLNGDYPIELLTFIPSPYEMLRIQCQGRRYVTWLTNPEDQNRQIGRHLGSLAFLLHDLEHADKFFHDRDSYWGQVKFFRCLKKSWDLGKFANYYREPLFAKDFDYVMSDMNSHPMHLLKYLKAIVLMHQLRAHQLHSHQDLAKADQHTLDLFWRDIFSDWGFDSVQIEAGVRLNRPQLEKVDDGILIAKFFTDNSLEEKYEPKNSYRLSEPYSARETC